MKRAFDEIDRSSASSTNTVAETQAPPTKAVHVEVKLRKELSSGIFIDTPDFFETILQSKELDANIQPIFEACCVEIQGKNQEPYYDVNKNQWSNFGPPEGNQPEKSYYPRIAAVANKITKKCPSDVQPDRVVQWRDDHANTAPVSDLSNAVDVKPDMSATIGEPLPFAHWGRFMVPIEVKKEGTPEAAVFQLTKYIRQVFNENYDRRFVLGLVMSTTRFAMYLADRSGIIGSQTYDINKDPLIFIRMVAGIRMLPLELLGWDTTMGMVKTKGPGEGTLYPFSYFVDRANWHEYRYTMRMPKPDPNDPTKMLPDEWETFVLLAPLSIFRGEVIVGRATRLWKGCRLCDIGLPLEELQLFIIKDSWRDEGREVEGELYSMIHQWQQANDVEARGLAKMYSFGAVRIGKDKDTTKLIRRKLNVHGTPRELDRQQSPALREDSDYIPTDVHIDYLPPVEGTFKSPQVLEHQRLVIATYGWSLKSFATCTELVHVLEDVVIGLRDSYLAGVLHRDVSVGNILILPRTGQDVSVFGVLIDLDNAIKLGDRKTLHHDPLTGTIPFMSGELLMKKHYFRPQQKGAKPSTARAQDLDDSDSDDNDSDDNNLLQQQKKNSKKRALPIDFDNIFGSGPVATGSQADQKAAQPQPPAVANTKSLPKHHRIHDHEALFWSLVWLSCRTSGPCTRTPDLDSDLPRTKPLRDMFFSLFEHSPATIGLSKAMIIKDTEELEDNVIPFITTFCSPMIGLIRSWHSILHKAYRTGKYSSVSRKFLRAVQDAQEEIGVNPYKFPLPESWGTSYNAELHRRLHDNDKLSWGTSFPTPSKVRQTPPAGQKGASTSRGADREEGSPTPPGQGDPKRMKHAQELTEHSMSRRSSTVSLRSVAQSRPNYKEESTEDEDEDEDDDPMPRGREKPKPNPPRSQPRGRGGKGKGRAPRK